MDTPLLLRTTQLLGLTTSFFLSGYSFAAPSYSLPSIALAPLPLRIQQWGVVYNKGKFVSPPLGALALLLWLGLAWSAYGTGVDGSVTAAAAEFKWKAYVAAGLLTVGILPWTVLVLGPTNSFLLEGLAAVEKGGVLGEARAKALGEAVVRWGTLNWMRVVLPLVGGWIGLLGLLA